MSFYLTHFFSPKCPIKKISKIKRIAFWFLCRCHMPESVGVSINFVVPPVWMVKGIIIICQVGNLNSLRTTKFGGSCYISMWWIAGLSGGGGQWNLCVYLPPTTRSASGLTLIRAMRPLSHPPPLLVLLKQDLPNWVASASDIKKIKLGAH